MFGFQFSYTEEGTRQTETGTVCKPEMRILLLILLGSYSDLGALGECLTSNILGTTSRDVLIDIQEFNLKEMMESVLDLTLLAKEETIQLIKEDIVRTDSKNEMCSIAGEGVNLQNLDRFNRTFGIPILTSARIVNQKILIPGRERGTLIDLNLLSTLLSSIGMENHVDLAGNQALVFLQSDNRKIITNFDSSRPICVM